MNFSSIKYLRHNLRVKEFTKVGLWGVRVRRKREWEGEGRKRARKERKGRK